MSETTGKSKRYGASAACSLILHCSLYSALCTIIEKAAEYADPFAQPPSTD